MNYKASPLARGLRSRRSQTIGVMVPEISGGYSAAVLSGIEDVLLLSGFFYFVVSHHHRDELLRDYPALLLSRAVEGIIAVDSALDLELPVPIVAVSGHLRIPSILNIELDHNLAARYALEHLQRLGHRRIAFIKGQSFSSDTEIRWQAIAKVAAELHIAIDPRLVVALEGDDPTPEPGRVATHKVLAAGAPFTAIFAFNDLSAMGAIVALREAGSTSPRNFPCLASTTLLALRPTIRRSRPFASRCRRWAGPPQPLFCNAYDTPKTAEPLPHTAESILVLPTFVERKSTAAAPIK